MQIPRTSEVLVKLLIKRCKTGTTVNAIIMKHDRPSGAWTENCAKPVARSASLDDFVLTADQSIGPERSWLFCRSALMPISVISAHRSATSCSALRSALFFDSRSLFRSAYVTFRPAPHRFRSAHTNSLHQCKRTHNFTTLLTARCA